MERDAMAAFTAVRVYGPQSVNLRVNLYEM